MPRERDLSKIRSTIERRAHLIVDMMESQAQRVVDSIDEPPPGTQEPDPEMVRRMWQWSPFANHEQMFWRLHDATLQKMLAEITTQPMAGDERLNLVRQAHSRAEYVALSRVYPHRAALVQLGITTLERSVELAKRAERLVRQTEGRRAPERREAMAY